jgi:hypothetical protein
MLLKTLLIVLNSEGMSLLDIDATSDIVEAASINLHAATVCEEGHGSRERCGGGVAEGSATKVLQSLTAERLSAAVQ